MRISDWSSDVCSSDLKDMIAAILHLSADWISGERVARSRIPAAVLDQFSIILTAETDKTIYAATMSDERLVEAIIREHYPHKEVSFVAFLPDRIDDFVDRMQRMKIGRASCRERVCQYVKISVVAESLKKKK